MFAKLIDKFDNQYENVKALFSKQNSKTDNKIETLIHPLTLQVKDNSETLSSMKVSYDECIEKISYYNKTITKFDTSRKEN